VANPVTENGDRLLFPLTLPSPSGGERMKMRVIGAGVEFKEKNLYNINS